MCMYRACLNPCLSLYATIRKRLESQLYTLFIEWMSLYEYEM